MYIYAYLLLTRFSFITFPSIFNNSIPKIDRIDVFRLFI